jgi:DNA-binding NarL/FixJ family response regulator
VRVVVADDEMLTREGIVRVRGDAGLDVVGQAANVEELMRHVRDTRPDAAIVDIRMPPTHTDEGIAAAQLGQQLRGQAVLHQLATRSARSSHTARRSERHLASPKSST